MIRTPKNEVKETPEVKTSLANKIGSNSNKAKSSSKDETPKRTPKETRFCHPVLSSHKSLGASSRQNLSNGAQNGMKTPVFVKNLSNSKPSSVKSSKSIFFHDVNGSNKMSGTPSTTPSNRKTKDFSRISGHGMNKSFLGASPFPMSSPSAFKNRRSYQQTPTPTRKDLNKLRKSDSILDSSLLDYNFLKAEKEEEESSIFVGVRVRPLSSRESKTLTARNIIQMSETDICVTTNNDTDSHLFSYDYCLDSMDPSSSSYASQSDVYNIMGAPLLEKAFEGYNVCLLAYGQTGSGKTYCIMGDACGRTISADAGVIPRFCWNLFHKIEEMNLQNHINEEPTYKVAVEVSYVEIYNEKLYDLLALNGGDQREALKVREHPKHGPYIVGASSHIVESYEELQSWLMLGNQERSIAATGINDKSSRSHSVFSLKLMQSQIEWYGDEMMSHDRVSIINLVDLAGSERIATAQSQGDRLKEGVCINKSLLTLGKVISALAESNDKRKMFVPYRESLLTWLLKESLGGNSRTCILATISPSNFFIEETLSTLRYACQARKIINRNYINEDAATKIIRAIREREEKVIEAEKSLKEKLEKSHLNGISYKLEKKEPTLINLCEDEQLSQTLFFKLKVGETSIGQKKADIILRNLPNQSVYCIITNEVDKLTISSQNANDIYINGEPISKPTEIFHNDRMAIAAIYHFRVSFPTEERSNDDMENDKKYDFCFARDELLKAQEKRIREEHAEEKEKLFKQLDEYNTQIQTLEDDKYALLSELDEERKVAVDSEMERLKLMEENQFLAEIRNQNFLDEKDDFSGDQTILSPNDDLLNKIEDIFNESLHIASNNRRDSYDVEAKINFMVTEANHIFKALKKPYVAKKVNQLSNGIIEPKIVINDTQHHFAAKVGFSQFQDILSLLRDIAQGEQSNENSLETLLKWEREEEISSVSFIADKIRSTSRMSLNGSFNKSPSLLNTSLRQSLVNRRNSLLMSRNINKPNSSSSQSDSAIVASALRVSLSNQSPLNVSALHTVNAMMSLSEVYVKAKELAELLKESCLASSEDEITNSITNLVVIIQKCNLWLSLISSQEVHYDHNAALEVQDDLKKQIPTLNRITIKILQCIEKNLDGLIVNEISSLVAALESLLTLVTSFEVCTCLPIQDPSFYCQNNILEFFLNGLNQGYLRQIKSAQKSAETSVNDCIGCIKDDKLYNYEANFLNILQNCLKRVSKFLEMLSKTNTSITSLNKNQNKIVNSSVQKWISNVQANSKNIQLIKTSLVHVCDQLINLKQDKLDYSHLFNKVNNLHTSVLEIVSTLGKTKNCLNMDPLRKMDKYAYIQEEAINSIQSLQVVISECINDENNSSVLKQIIMRKNKYLKH